MGYKPIAWFYRARGELQCFFLVYWMYSKKDYLFLLKHQFSQYLMNSQTPILKNIKWILESFEKAIATEVAFYSWKKSVFLELTKEYKWWNWLVSHTGYPSAFLSGNSPKSLLGTKQESLFAALFVCCLIFSNNQNYWLSVGRERKGRKRQGRAEQAWADRQTCCLSRIMNGLSWSHSTSDMTTSWLPHHTKPMTQNRQCSIWQCANC